MPRAPKHQLTAQQRKKGQLGSRRNAGAKSRIRQQGWFIDAAGFIMQWRLNGGKGHPPEAALREYLKGRGWTAERGGELSVQEIGRMLDSMDPNKDLLPTSLEWWDAERTDIIIPGTEITTVAIHPEGWKEFREELLSGKFKPSWRANTIKSDEGDGSTVSC